MKKNLPGDFPINIGGYYDLIDEIMLAAQHGKGESIFFANAHMMVEAYRDKRFLEIVKRAWMVTPDGKPLTWALRLLYGIKQERVAGMDLLPVLLARSEMAGLPIFFYGGTTLLLTNTIKKLKVSFPALTIAGFYSPPFRKLSSLEESEIEEKIRESGARLIFVVLGCPKQELWMSTMEGKFKALVIGVGGALPVFAGMRHRAPKWMQDMGLEWLFRLCQEPRRLFKRYAVTNSLFIYLILKELFRKKLLNKSSLTE